MPSCVQEFYELALLHDRQILKLRRMATPFGLAFTHDPKAVQESATHVRLHAYVKRCVNVQDENKFLIDIAA